MTRRIIFLASLVLCLSLLGLSQSQPAQNLQQPAQQAPARQLAPFLTLPVEHSKISEAWFYDTELRFHPSTTRHAAIDFRAARGTPVYAAADGLAIQSFHTFIL